MEQALHYPAGLVRACRTYTHHICRMGDLFDRDDIEQAECVRKVLHQSVMYELRSAGIQYRDKCEAEALAWQITQSS